MANPINSLVTLIPSTSGLEQSYFTCLFAVLRVSLDTIIVQTGFSTGTISLSHFIAKTDES
jgi:hypothetical protein